MDLVSFDASNASDPDGFIRTYAWDFGDNTTGTGPNVTHAFPDLGERDIVLTVTDDDGNTDSATVRITILPVIRPSVNISAVPTIPREEEPVFFTAEDLVDPKGLIDRYTWQFGDRATASGPRTTHAFAREGSYTVTLVVSSSTFAELRTAAFYTGTASRSITVQPLDLPVPVLVVSPEKPAEKESVSFDASASHSAGGGIVSYRWDFGDGTGGDGARVFHAYPAPGTYPVVLTITDSRGRTGTVQKDLPVAAGYIFFLWPILAVSLIVAGYLGVRKFRQGIARKRRPRIPTTIGWKGRIATKGETGAGPHRIVVRFIGGVEDRNKKR
jgi:PKD repeat protein